MQIKRRTSRAVRIGSVSIGDGFPIAVQAMTKTATSDSERTLGQIALLQKAGCEIVRVAVRNREDAAALRVIARHSGLPLVADIHFDYRLALKAIENGVDKIRLNPGNIYKKDQVLQVARAARGAGIPIRVGVNSGSLPVFRGAASAGRGISDIMVKGTLDYLRILEKAGLYDIVISLKASNVLDTVEAYSAMARYCDYPFHLGLTATGLPFEGAIKSGIAIGLLLSRGIGDTIRVSLTDDPRREVRTAMAILSSLGLRSFGPAIISCPTCGRCEVDLIRVVRELEKRISSFPARPLKVAVMGCVVNGPGEARDADIGIAFGKKEGLLFKGGRAVRKVPLSRCVDVLLEEIGRMR